MHILKRELRAGLKPFLFWTLGLFVLVFAGMTKYTGIEAGGVSVNELLAQFPRVVQAVLGVVGIDIGTLGGYYAVLAYFALICISIYGIHLGGNAVSREATDKTYEFIFTKPRSRSYILLMKLAAGFLYLIAFSALNYAFSVGAVATLGLSENLHVEMLLFTVALFLVGGVFFALSAFLSAIARRADRGGFYGNLCFLMAFILGMVYDMLENGGLLQLLSPFKYFLPADLLSGRLDPVYAALCVGLSLALLAGTLWSFDRKDLSAVA